jgi:23S rRNA pseudouridine1911/1915/1917 synthase
MKENKYKILFEDNEIIAVDKPTGMLSIPDRFDKQAPSISKILEQKRGKIFIVHRLDRDTSGVMLFAKNEESHRNLSLQFQNSKVERIYHVLVSGIVDEDEFQIDIPIGAHPSKKGVMAPSARGKESLTIMKVMERFRHATLTECRLITGRQHQIRVHCSAIGYPLLVDPLYGGGQAFLVSSIKRKYKLKKHTIEQPIISRITMLSKRIGFEHPDGSGQISFESDYPRDFAAALQVLRKYSGM